MIRLRLRIKILWQGVRLSATVRSYIKHHITSRLARFEERCRAAIDRLEKVLAQRRRRPPYTDDFDLAGHEANGITRGPAVNDEAMRFASRKGAE